MPPTRFTILLTLLLTTPLFANWPQFRGPNSSGIATGPPPPTTFAPGKNELWSTPIAAGHSSPCIYDNNIFLTSFDRSKNQLQVLCINRADGKTRWTHPIPVKKLESGHPSFNPASSTPTSDGKIIVAYFGSFGLIALDIHGKKLWDFKLPLARSYSGNGTSPIIVGNKLILYRANYVDHFLIALDKTTGKQIWKHHPRERFTTPMSAAATPIVLGDKLIIHAVQSIQAFNIDTGKKIWHANASTTATSTPILAGNNVITATWNQTGEPALVPPFPPYDQLVKDNDKNGDKAISPDEFPKNLHFFHRAEGTDAPQNGFPLRFHFADKNRNRKIERDEWQNLLNASAARRKRHQKHGLVSININNSGLITDDKLTHLERNGIPEVPSPIYHKGYIYFVKNGGILTCINAKTKKRIYRIRTKGKGTHYASPVIAGNHIYTTSGTGQISVITTGPNPKVIALNKLPHNTFATPAIVNATIYIRTHAKLYAFKSKN